LGPEKGANCSDRSNKENYRMDNDMNKIMDNNRQEWSFWEAGKA
jgi:hypothetical protein